MKKNKSIKDLLIEYFKAHTKEDMSHGPVVDWVETKYKKLYNKKPRDTWRSIRNLHQTGFLVKVKKGIYRYDPSMVKQRELEDFTSEQKKQIFEKDNYRCVQCGRRQDEGYELHADHRIPKDKGGKAMVDNGQTLCPICNFRKKNYGQTESGKKMLIRLWEASIKIGDEKTKKFCEEVLKVYERFDINGHIEWKK
ncbi:HNH endonuclease [Candidatus Nomurabacteria bacterium RIFCSPHIGHO2_02_FULL_37_13]|uniref:HNH endonuclease n=1 Tax=Candidatus Nomurabacteria bacterium RIFCSPHIGHO2_02_FULL_37_13 TaxID=1801750 RepID=A0A1F6W595_9BACT|nr:MAG: HNH endonuclease [Candidatus Nomurabacteria bacterium RIFCSPHIGHO2_01_FULL_36_23]OGI76855.1 MAG: HNH endonuclease [Candidatus Nomurabacteria bacterium RIFCSPHIGHO2_02_FULL_37_13]OGI87826.1 MAG: HNH endonuclease [Candidatus Nomurabacteria bacterium RIFCSPLOWO2_01_FULL_37_25]